MDDTLPAPTLELGAPEPHPPPPTAHRPTVFRSDVGGRPTAAPGDTDDASRARRGVAGDASRARPGDSDDASRARPGHSDDASRARPGDSDDGDAGHGFEWFYRARRDPIARGLALTLGDVHLAAEATDEAMARAYERWATVSRLDRPEAWVHRIGLNWSLSVLRRRRRSLHRLYQPPPAGDPPIADPAVHEALGGLDVKHRSVVVCRHLLGWSVAETAAALGIRPGTVKSRLHRAHEMLRSRLSHLRATP